MDVVFIDDAGQRNPSRPGMDNLLSVGGLYVPENNIRVLEQQLQSLCEEYHFPVGEMFKWSPGRDLWMHDNLIGERRTVFMNRALNYAVDIGAKAVVIISDTQYKTATDSPSHEIDLLKLFLERVHWILIRNKSVGLAIASQPSGDRRAENKFLSSCLETLTTGTEYVDFEKIPLGVLSCSPRFIRTLQLADIIASCTTAFVSGESNFSPPVFCNLLRLFEGNGTNIGGIGLKIHPDNVYCNLYHWLLGDNIIWRGNTGHRLPLPRLPYSESPDRV